MFDPSVGFLHASNGLQITMTFDTQQVHGDFSVRYKTSRNIENRFARRLARDYLSIHKLNGTFSSACLVHLQTEQVFLGRKLKTNNEEHGVI